MRPSEFSCYVVENMEVFLTGKKCALVRKSDSFVLSRIYIVSLDQAFDLIRIKNYKLEAQANPNESRKTMLDLQDYY